MDISQSRSIMMHSHIIWYYMLNCKNNGIIYIELLVIVIVLVKIENVIMAPHCIWDIVYMLTAIYASKLLFRAIVFWY